MPSLVAYGRRWAIASDDFVFPELTEAFVRLAWIFFGVVVFIFHFPLSCTTKDITFPILILLVLNGITVALALLTAAISSKGTILNDLPRKHVATLLYIRLPVLVVEVIWTIISTFQAFESPGVDTACHFTTVIKVTIILEWILIFCVILGVIFVFHPIDEDGMEDVSIIARRTWSRRFRIFKIRQDALMRAALDDIANLLASFFQEGDVVFSDVVAGLLLVVHSPTNVNPPLMPAPTTRAEWMTEKNALHFLHFATCVYGWPTYIMHNCGIGPIAKLFRKMQCCGSLRCDQVLVIEDNCCFCNTAAFVLSTEMKNIDLFFVSFRNRLCEVPFVVFADHDTNSVVVTIRGSCSIMDLITDLCLDDEVLSVDVDTDPVLAQDSTLDNGEVRVHRGMLRSARYVFDCLRKHRVLEDMFVLNPTYKLVVCGHSLGAGVASLLTLLLKQQYPDIQCFAFSPPGCVISEEGLGEMENHVMSVVGGDDFVSRISYQSMFRLREKVDLELKSCDKAKYEILIRGVFRLFFKSPWAPLSGISGTNADRTNLIAETASTATYGSAIEIDEPQDDIFPASSLVPSRVQLYAPGKILYVAKENMTLIREWIDARCLSDVKLSASAITDHLPKNLTNVMEQIVQEAGEPDVHVSI
ncbi:unnamed protein product [Auanema sp. JU1783]|nr:unnamed protein product [Auanema sp. JU1783]